MASLTTPTVGAIIPSSGATIAIGTAGGAIVEGQPVYVSAAGTIILANADSSGSVTAATVAGLALHTCASGQKVMYVTADSALTHGLTASETAPGDVVILDDAAGRVTITAGDIAATDWRCVIGQINNPETTMRLAPMAPVLVA
jgi:Cu/Ag efflux protein CusF